MVVGRGGADSDVIVGPGSAVEDMSGSEAADARFPNMADLNFRRARSARRATANGTPMPIPIFAPVERPDLEDGLLKTTGLTT